MGSGFQESFKAVPAQGASILGLSSDKDNVKISDWLNIADTPSVWGGAPPANVVDTTPVLVGAASSRARAIRIPGTSNGGAPRIMGLGQAISAGTFVASVDLSVLKLAIHNAAQTAGCSAGLLWVDANGQNMRGSGFNLGGNRGIASPDTSAFSRFETWNASADGDNDPTGIWTVGGGSSVGYGDFRAVITVERNGADELFFYIKSPRLGHSVNINSAAIASAGGAGFLLVCMFIPTGAAYLFDLYVNSQLLIGTTLPWLIQS